MTIYMYMCSLTHITTSWVLRGFMFTLLFCWISLHALILGTVNQCPSSSSCHAYFIAHLLVLMSSSPPPSPSFGLSPTPCVMVSVSCLVVLNSTAHTRLSWSVRVDLCNATNSLCPALSEHHPGAHVQELWTLDEAEPACGLVTSPEVVFVHCEYGGSLSCTTTMNCGE